MSTLRKIYLEHAMDEGEVVGFLCLWKDETSLIFVFLPKEICENVGY